MLFINGCAAKVNNRVSFKNLAAATVYVNFRGQLITVLPGAVSSVTEIPKGSYEYSTTYQVPAGALSSSSQGAVSGIITINAGTQVLVIYSSTLLNNTYLFSATISTSEEITGSTNP